MKKILLLIILLVIVSGYKLYSQSNIAGVQVDSLYNVEINGTKQKILVQTNNTNNPVLLWLHGGPGGSAMLMAHHYTNDLKNHYTIVNWDQRGAGLSHYDNLDTTLISEEQIIQDALELTKYLIDNYEKQKIFILGHSFGSVIGMHLAERFPQYYYAYIGMGQIVNFKKSKEIVFNWLLETLQSAGNTAGIKEIKGKGFPDIRLVRKYGGETHTGIDKHQIIKESPYYYEGYLDDRFKGLRFTRKYMNKYAANIPKSVDEITELKIPVYFFVGRYDHVPACANEVVEEYFKSIKAPQKGLVWFEKSAHYPNLEESRKFQQELIDLSRGYLSGFLLPGNNGYILSRFGPRWGRMHYGTDIKMNKGDTVVAVQSGTVIRSNWGTRFGRIIIIQHQNNIQTYYAHLSKFIKKKGERVEKGEAIGLAGSTGNARGPHLHFEIHENGKAFDPELVFNFKDRKIRDEAFYEETLTAIHKKLKPKGYSNNAAVPEYYKVQSGDSLWVISRRFKISIKTICRLNHISENSVLHIGQPLKMY